VSDHFDTEDSRTDLCDFYVFPSRDRADHSVLILDVNPEASVEVMSTDPGASYEIKIDTDGDLEPDVAFHFLFTSRPDGGSTASVFRAEGMAAQGTGRTGEAVIVDCPVPVDGSAVRVSANGYRFFAGLRSDPHFKDAKGLRNNFQFTGDDPIARRNVFGIVLEVPNAALGGSSVRLWARAMTMVEGEVRQVDQAGRPGINNTFNGPEVDRLAFDATSPSEQRALFEEKFIAFLKGLGYSDAEAGVLALEYLPDVLTYDPARAQGYPNGRTLTDDTADLIVSLLTKGRITSDLVGPHNDLLDEFPYLGRPHPASIAATHTE
jgi:hypothetical protein